jgi:hypothetical protein
VERAFGALKGRFGIIDNKSFHKYKTQVKLVFVCCILHNWIIGSEEGFVADLDQDEQGELPLEEPAMVTVRDEICNAMWAARGSSRT